MTMDIHQREREREFLAGSPSPPRHSSSPPPVVTQQKPSKRSFDVAFLMAPDDLSKKKQHQLRLVTTASLMQRYAPSQLQLPQPEPNTLPIQSQPFSILLQNPREFSNISKEDEVISATKSILPQFTKSAFTKVSSNIDQQPRIDIISNISSQQNQQPRSPSSISSNEGISPDVSYQESLSPPVISRERTPPYMLPPSKTLQTSPHNLPYFISGSSKPSSYLYQTCSTSRDKLSGSESNSPIDQQIHINQNNINNNVPGTSPYLSPYLSKSPPLITTNNEKSKTIRSASSLLYPGSEGLPTYGGLTVATYPFPTNFTPVGVPTVTQHPLLTAAANVTAALLPPSLAALSLPAQNVCAKCNVSFRMTSDLVYHMRSHHKNDHVTTDSARRRREQEKLKCPVCNESFRERHHLTRHMTAHQDKAGDHDEVTGSNTRTRLTSSK